MSSQLNDPIISTNNGGYLVPEELTPAMEKLIREGSDQIANAQRVILAKAKGDVKVLTPESLHVTVGRIDVNVDQCGHGTIKVDGVNLKARSVQIDVNAGEQPVVTVQVIP